MDGFFIEFRDPLFSIIIFFVIIFMITFSSYWWGRYKSTQNSKYLDDFLQQFRALPSKDELKNLMSSGELSEKSWLLLASSYFKNGDYEKSIEIYSELLHISGGHNKRDTMFLLGKTYFKAGFLERSKQIFLEILKTTPRTPQALRYLLLIYEYMRDYDAALEVLEPLEELNEDISLDTIYLKTMAILHDSKLSIEEKTDKILKIYREHHQLSYMVFEYLFRMNPVLAWQHFDSSKCELLSDILWRVDFKDLNLDIISKNGYLRELYTARSDVNLAQGSDIFELDILINLKGNASATLSFEYICENCKVVFPFVFHRCSSCHCIDTARVEISLSKDYHRDYGEENNSFQ